MKGTDDDTLASLLDEAITKARGSEESLIGHISYEPEEVAIAIAEGYTEIGLPIADASLLAILMTAMPFLNFLSWDVDFYNRPLGLQDSM